MPPEPVPRPSAAASTAASTAASAVASTTWRVDPSVLTAHFGSDTAAYHLRTGRSYRLPSLPERIRELLETGCELDVAASPPTPEGSGTGGHAQPEVDRLIEMLEREQLIMRVSGAPAEAERVDHGDLFLIISADRAKTRESAVPDAPPALRASSVLQRAPRVVVELTGGRIRVAVSVHQGQTTSGGAHVLRLLDAFERPRTVYEVIRVLQGRVREVQGWVGMIEALVRLFDVGALCEVKAEGRLDLTAPVPSTHSSI